VSSRRLGSQEAGVLIEAVAHDVLDRLLHEIAEVWIGTTDGRLREILPRHAARNGFRFFTARSNARLAGFAYGYLGAPGQWWHDIVFRSMTSPQRARWLAPGHFEVVELHVHPEFRRRGIGGRLHDALLDGLASRTAVLSTQVDNEPALALYTGRGWEIVVPSLRFAPAADRYAILALDRAAPGRRPADRAREL
jgi:ribosomal protein S18 acetylase RimI-like enzyme